jgi:dTDP-4-dehydrorhamnose 3,5-epimerase
MPFKFSRLSIADVVVVEAQAFRDSRGFFMESYRKSAFAANGMNYTFVQDNYSHSIKGVIRGLHYQKNPKPQGKLVGVIRGKIFDVAVDIRKGSPTYGKWVSEILSQENHRMLYVPIGFAHGFCALEESDVLYKVTEEFAQECDRAVLWNDPEIDIKWPIENPILSAKDSNAPRLKDVDNDFSY